MKVAIIILNYNGEKDTIECLESVQKLSTGNYELLVIVVDNASKDESVSKIKAQFPDIVILENKDNLGFSGGNNVGIKYALNKGASYVLVLNNDTFLHKDLLKELITVIEKEKNIGIVAPKIYFAPGFEFHKDRYKKDELGKVIWYAGGIMDWKNIIGHHRGVDEIDKGQYDNIEENGFASGNCMLVKKEVFEKVGLFDERYFLYYEDNDFCFRVKKAGYKIVFAPKGILWHKNASSAGGSGSSLQDYYITRNRLFFGMRYASVRAKIALLKESIKIVLKGRYWQRRGILDFYLGKFNKGSYPINH